MPLLVVGLVVGEPLAERPVPVHQRHADRGIGVEHLLGGDDLDLIGIDVEPELAEGDLAHRIVDPSRISSKFHSGPSNSGRTRTLRRGSMLCVSRHRSSSLRHCLVVGRKQLVEHGVDVSPVRPRAAWRSSFVPGRFPRSRAKPASPTDR